MNASLALACCLAVFNAGPEVKLNQPSAAQVRVAPSVVVPVGYVDEDDGDLQRPPAPAPQFPADADGLQIEFEFSQPESCHDSDVFLPAPPAEIESPGPIDRQRSSAAPLWRMQFPTIDIQPTAACDEPSPLTPLAELTPASDRVQHLRQAMQHLQAAGLPELARDARDSYLQALEQHRQQLQWELELTTQELERARQEIGQRQEETRFPSDGKLFRARLRGIQMVPPVQEDSKVSPSSNVVPAPSVPMSAVPATPTPLRLINPSFYVGEAPPRVAAAWRQAFVPDAPRWVAPPQLRSGEFRAAGQHLQLLVPVPVPSLGPARPTYPAAEESPDAEFELPPAPEPEARSEQQSKPVA
jgi:hypothetical protein